MGHVRYIARSPLHIALSSHNDIDSTPDIYIKVGAHKGNGELIEGINFGSVSANTSNRIEIDRSYVFQDSDTDGHIAQFFFTLYGRLADYQGIEYKDAIWGYSNSFEEIEDDICQYPSSDKVDFWHGTWNKVCLADHSVLMGNINPISLSTYVRRLAMFPCFGVDTLCHSVYSRWAP